MGTESAKSVTYEDLIFKPIHNYLSSANETIKNLIYAASSIGYIIIVVLLFQIFFGERKTGIFGTLVYFISFVPVELFIVFSFVALGLQKPTYSLFSFIVLGVIVIYIGIKASDFFRKVLLIVSGVLILMYGFLSTKIINLSSIGAFAVIFNWISILVLIFLAVSLFYSWTLDKKDTTTTLGRGEIDLNKEL
jgi:hypothetical protein